MYYDNFTKLFEMSRKILCTLADKRLTEIQKRDLRDLYNSVANSLEIENSLIKLHKIEKKYYNIFRKNANFRLFERCRA